MSTYKYCFIGNLNVELYNDKIKPEPKPLNFIHSNITYFFIKALNKTIHFIYNNLVTKLDLITKLDLVTRFDLIMRSGLFIKEE